MEQTMISSISFVEKVNDLIKSGPVCTNALPEDTLDMAAICEVKAGKIPVRKLNVEIPDDLPSYLRTTKNFKAKAEQEDQVILEKAKKFVPSQRPANIRSSLLAPTASSLSRQAKDEKPRVPMPVSPHGPNDILEKPQGQRITDVKPFNLITDRRSKGSSPSLTTEELQLLKAQEEAKMFAARKTPSFVKNSRPIAPRKASKPKNPDEIVKPFELRSLQRHQKAQEELKNKIMQESTEKEQKAKFKAQDWSKDKAATPVVPSKPEPPPLTKAVGFVSSAESRAQHRESLAKEQAQPEQEEETKVEFRARAMPNFDSPFAIDHSKARSPTVPLDFHFPTENRFGKAVTPAARGSGAIEQDQLGVTRGYLDGQGYVAPFVASLRGQNGPHTERPRSKGTTWCRAGGALNSPRSAGPIKI